MPARFGNKQARALKNLNDFRFVEKESECFVYGSLVNMRHTISLI